jgi:hypothetical protein
MKKFFIQPIATKLTVPPTHFVPNKVAGGGGGSKSTTKVVIPKEFAMKPIFNNTIFYKPHTTSVGVGTVRNARHMVGKT